MLIAHDGSGPSLSRSSQREMVYWAAFVGSQVVSGIAAAFANVHTNPLPLLASLVLLLPGILLMDELTRLPIVGAWACVMLTNFVAWFSLRKLVARLEPASKTDRAGLS